MNTTNNQQETDITPKLRFPEFQTMLGWKKLPLSDIFNRITLKNKENNQNVLTISAQYGLISQLDFFNKAVSAKDVTGYYLLGKGDFAYNKSYSSGYPYGAIKPLKLYDKGVVSTLYICFKLKDKYSKYGSFFEHYFESGMQNNEIGKIAQEGARNHGLLNIGIQEFFNEVNVLIPQMKEQQKIADCLSSIDELINFREQKLAALKQHKKGLMQQLFPSHNDLQASKQASKQAIVYPKLRFPQFKDCKGWRVMRLGSIFNFFPTNSFSRDKLDERNGTIKNIHYGDIHTKFSALFDIEKESVPFISDAFMKKIRENHYCKEGDLIFADASEDLDDIGKAIEIVNLNNEIMVSGLHTLLARPIESYFSIGFLGYLFQSNLMKKQIQKESQGTKVLGISTKRLNDILVIFPSTQEQPAIAECLSSLDKLISEENEQIGRLKDHKKGLMQQLFPIFRN